MEKANFIDDNETVTSFFVLMDTVINETTYILASDSDPEGEDAECFILKKIGEDENEAVYEPVEDDEEFTSVSKIFEELLSDEDVDLI